VLKSYFQKVTGSGLLVNYMGLQIEDGEFTRISNEVLEQLVKTPLPPLELRIAIFVIRKTWGYNKTTDIISLTQFEENLLACRPAIVHSIKNLVARNILVKTPLLGNKISYKFNKYWNKWVVKTPKLVKYKSNLSKDALTKSSLDALTHKRNKDNTKDISVGAIKLQDCTNEVFNLFYKTINPNINFANKTEREATEWLISKYGLDKTLAAAKYAISVQNDRFASTITTPYQLKSKMASLAKYKTSRQPKESTTLIL
jgi:phage replication O-like protein O